MAIPASIHNIPVILAASLGLGACSGDIGTDDTGDTGSVGACEREPIEDDAVRRMVLAHPFDSAGAASGQFEVFDVDPVTPELTPTGHRFEMRRAFLGEIVFTPDGRHGYVAHDDGTIGAFELSPDGEPSVVHDGFGDGLFYATGLAMDPGGETLWVTDGNWPENGGGVYAVPVGCDGRLGTPTRSFETKNATRLSIANGVALLGSRGINDGDEARNVHLVDLEGGVLSSAAGFPDDEAAMSVALLTDDGQFGFIGDNSGFASVPNRVAIVGVADGELEPLGTVDIEDPVWMVASPFNDVVLVASGFENEILTLRREGGSYSLLGVAAPAPLPAAGVRLTRGAGAGLVFFAENQGVRVLRFDGGGVVTFLGPWPIGGGSEAIVGAIGIQP